MKKENSKKYYKKKVSTNYIDAYNFINFDSTDFKNEFYSIKSNKLYGIKNGVEILILIKDGNNIFYNLGEYN